VRRGRRVGAAAWLRRACALEVSARVCGSWWCSLRRRAACAAIWVTRSASQPMNPVVPG